MWQLPYGNTKRSQMDNSWGHFRDNIVETLLGESDYSTLKRYRDAGVVAIVFGQGASGTTCPCDADNNGQLDDGGYFHEVAKNYIARGPLLTDPTLPPSATPTPDDSGSTTPTRTPVPTPSSESTLVPTPSPEPTPDLNSVGAKIEQRFDDGIVISWNDTGAESYEMWWGKTENLAPGEDCNSAPNCLFPTGNTYHIVLPENIDQRYFIIVTRDGGQVTDVSDVLFAFRTTNQAYLPSVIR